MSSSPHSMSTKLPFAQSAKASPTQPLSVHVLFAVRDSNCELSCCASLPFWSAKEEVEPDVSFVAVAVVVVAGAAPQAEAVSVSTAEVDVAVAVSLSPPELALLKAKLEYNKIRNKLATHPTPGS